MNLGKKTRWSLAVFVGVVALALGISGWALNRYVIDHVAIADVAAYEAQVAGSPSGATTMVDPSTVVPSATSGTPAATGAGTGGGSVSTPQPKAVTEPASPKTAAAPNVTVRKVVTGTGFATVTYFVADVVLGDATTLRSAFAENKFGDNIVANTSVIAEANDALLAINGDYYGYRRSGILIRNGVIYRDDPARQGLALYRDGHVSLYDEKATSAAELLAAGVWNTLSFGPGILEGGVPVAGIENIEIDTNIGHHSIQGNQPRTGIGMISPNHLLFVAVDGRSNGYSRGVTLNEFAIIFKNLGATVAYNLDGGGSTTMYFDGTVVNNPLGKGKERGTSDILYVARSK